MRIEWQKITDFKKSFTLMELVIVVVIVGVLSVIALPRFNKTMERSYEADALSQLKTIHGANKIQYARTLSYWPASGTQNVASINSNLNLNLIENGFTFSCTGNGSTFSCTAARNGGAFILQVDEADLVNGTNPCCSAGSCPTKPSC